MNGATVCTGGLVNQAQKGAHGGKKPLRKNPKRPLTSLDHAPGETEPPVRPKTSRNNALSACRARRVTRHAAGGSTQPNTTGEESRPPGAPPYAPDEPPATLASRLTPSRHAKADTGACREPFASATKAAQHLELAQPLLHPPLR
jgi:hypothetical protein